MKAILFIFLQHLAPQKLLSRLAGKLADCRIGWIKNFLIKHFVRLYEVNLDESKIEDYREFSCFNEFFGRELKPGARTWEDDELSVICPADGAISEVGSIDKDQVFQAKGKSFSLTALLGGDKNLSNHFQNGQFATIYLSPKDYHRFHMPCNGVLEKMIYVPGALFSVNQTTAEHVDSLFARNERVVAIFKTPHGPMALVFVGAMIVASIETTWAGLVAPPGKAVQTINYSEPAKIELNKGDECGKFRLGSTVIAVFPENAMGWSENLKAGVAVKMGETIGRFSE